MSKWREVRLGDCTEINKRTFPKDYQGKIRYIDISSVSEGNLKGYNEIEFQNSPSRARRLIQDDDIIYSTVRPNLKGYYKFNKNVPKNIVVSTGFVVLSKTMNASIDYIYYYITEKSFVNYLINVAKGAAYPAVGVEDFAKAKVNLPDLKTQTKIANVLSTNDKLIENNNRRIKILEQAAEELYKEWFVRMRFPGYEKTKFHKGIPEGWEIIRIKDLGEVITGKTPPTNDEENYGGEVMFVKTPDMNGNLFTIETESYLSNKGNDSQPKKLIPEDSIMVSCIGTGGVVSINGYLAHTNQQINSIVLKKAFEREWAYFTLHSMKGTIELFGATGATMTNLSKGKFENLKILYPSNGLVSRYHTLTKGIFSKIKNLNIQNRNLKKQRDLLLPRLMNGTITVK